MSPEELIIAIIREQSLIIGEDLAKSRAQLSGVVDFSTSNIDDLSLKNQESPEVAIDKIVSSYGEVFGQASIEVCLDVLRKFSYNEVDPFISDSIKGALRK